MKQHFNNGQEYLMVEVAPDARNFRILNESEDCYKAGDLLYDTSQNVWAKGNNILPPGQWQILFLASEATEEQAGEVVETGFLPGDTKAIWVWRDYTGTGNDHFSTALESLSSLLSSQNMQGETLFLKRVK